MDGPFDWPESDPIVGKMKGIVHDAQQCDERIKKLSKKYDIPEVKEKVDQFFIDFSKAAHFYNRFRDFPFERLTKFCERIALIQESIEQEEKRFKRLESDAKTIDHADIDMSFFE